MPSIGEFTRAFAAITGTEFGSIMKLQRVLRDAGLLTTGARGVNAPDMVPLDAARMLIAVLVSDKPSLAPRAVEEFGRLPVADRVGGHHLAASCFEEVLTALIEAFSESSGESRDLLSRAATVSCKPSELKAAINWPGAAGAMFTFSAGGPWMHLLENPVGNAAKIDAIIAAQEAAASRGRMFSGYGTRVKIERTVDGILLCEIAAMFGSDAVRADRKAG